MQELQSTIWGTTLREDKGLIINEFIASGQDNSLSLWNSLCLGVFNWYYKLPPVKYNKSYVAIYPFNKPTDSATFKQLQFFVYLYNYNFRVFKWMFVIHTWDIKKPAEPLFYQSMHVFWLRESSQCWSRTKSRSVYCRDLTR